jgi:hypothetical protein
MMGVGKPGMAMHSPTEYPVMRSTAGFTQRSFASTPIQFSQSYV